MIIGDKSARNKGRPWINNRYFIRVTPRDVRRAPKTFKREEASI
jgi:hypothetical protein